MPIRKTESPKEVEEKQPTLAVHHALKTRLLWPFSLSPNSAALKTAQKRIATRPTCERTSAPSSAAVNFTSPCWRIAATPLRTDDPPDRDGFRHSRRRSEKASPLRKALLAEARVVGDTPRESPPLFNLRTLRESNGRPSHSKIPAMASRRRLSALAGSRRRS